jgi:hypothetical protein
MDQDQDLGPLCHCYDIIGDWSLDRCLGSWLKNEYWVGQVIKGLFWLKNEYWVGQVIKGLFWLKNEY